MLYCHVVPWVCAPTGGGLRRDISWGYCFFEGAHRAGCAKLISCVDIPYASLLQVKLLFLPWNLCSNHTTAIELVSLYVKCKTCKLLVIFSLNSLMESIKLEIISILWHQSHIQFYCLLFFFLSFNFTCYKTLSVSSQLASNQDIMSALQLVQLISRSGSRLLSVTKDIDPLPSDDDFTARLTIWRRGP